MGVCLRKSFFDKHLLIPKLSLRLDRGMFKKATPFFDPDQETIADMLVTVLTVCFLSLS